MSPRSTSVGFMYVCQGFVPGTSGYWMFRRWGCEAWAGQVKTQSSPNRPTFAPGSPPLSIVRNSRAVAPQEQLTGTRSVRCQLGQPPTFHPSWQARPRWNSTPCRSAQDSAAARSSAGSSSWSGRSVTSTGSSTQHWRAAPADVVGHGRIQHGRHGRGRAVAHLHRGSPVVRLPRKAAVISGAPQHLQHIRALRPRGRRHVPGVKLQHSRHRHTVDIMWNQICQGSLLFAFSGPPRCPAWRSWRPSSRRVGPAGGDVGEPTGNALTAVWPSSTLARITEAGSLRSRERVRP